MIIDPLSFVDSVTEIYQPSSPVSLPVVYLPVVGGLFVDLTLSSGDSIRLLIGKTSSIGT